jgi:hypothetical protein
VSQEQGNVSQCQHSTQHWLPAVQQHLFKAAEADQSAQVDKAFLRGRRESVRVFAGVAKQSDGMSQTRKVGEESTMEQAAQLLLLISPFFFWGTSMVAMKVLRELC